MSSDDSIDGGTRSSGRAASVGVFAALVSVVSSLMRIAWHRVGIRRSRRALDRG